MSVPFVKVNLVSLRKLNVLFFTELDVPNDVVFTLYQEDKIIDKPKIVRKTAANNLFFYELELKNDFVFGHHTYLYIPNYPMQIVDVSAATSFPQFDEMFYYFGNDLGVTYSKEKTTFKLWAPIACEVNLKIKLPNRDVFSSLKMNREANGVYSLTINGDLNGCYYLYSVNNSGIIREALDPYGKIVSLNSEYSVVGDVSFLAQREKIIPQSSYHKINDAIIYETNVRDLTEDKNSDIVNKGKFLGVAEENRKTIGGNPAGLDYLKFLGVTHIQFNPIIDFNSLKDNETDKKYNWGYDPISFFAIEGSYSLHPEDPLARLIEFRDMVDALHKANLRVVMDVVYNHIYEHATSCFEKIVPHYYFRRKSNGEISNGSGCGNDVASERPMVRKMLVDSVMYFINTFDVDGFRFDLMGLTDIGTMHRIEEMSKTAKPDIILYGEGWNMYCPLPAEKRSSIDNSFKLPGLGFFNDTFRDIVKGPTYLDRIKVKGYINGDLSYIHGFEYVFHASVLNHSYNPRFVFAHQSINYIECHDNSTLYDKLMQSNEGESDENIRRRILLANALTVISFGIPFIHMGQEVGLSKEGLDNTYNVMHVNRMKWKEVDEHFDMVIYLRNIINHRKNLSFLTLDNPSDIEKVFTVEKRDDGVLILSSDKKEFIGDKDKIYLIINPKMEQISIKLDGFYHIVTSEKPGFLSENVIVPPLRLMILYK